MELSMHALRVLGCLLEKEATTPDQYPLSSKALQTACNQKTSRDPVVDFSLTEVDQTIKELRLDGLARTVRQTGSRADKHRHVLDEAWGLSPAQLAVLAVLMLRGPQTPGELKTRTDRAYGFETLEDVESVLGTLARREDPFVKELQRQPGQHQSRWIHLLDDDAAADTPPELNGETSTRVATHLEGADQRASDVEAVAAALEPTSQAEASGHAQPNPHPSSMTVDGELRRLRSDVALLAERLSRLEAELGLDG